MNYHFRLLIGRLAGLSVSRSNCHNFFERQGSFTFIFQTPPKPNLDMIKFMLPSEVTKPLHKSKKNHAANECDSDRRTEK